MFFGWKPGITIELDATIAYRLLCIGRGLRSVGRRLSSFCIGCRLKSVDRRLNKPLLPILNLSYRLYFNPLITIRTIIDFTSRTGKTIGTMPVIAGSWKALAAVAGNFIIVNFHIFPFSENCHVI